MSDELKSIIDLLKKHGQMKFLEGAKEEQISDFEKDNSFKFPSKFRDWLLFSDGGECYLPAGVQFYGIAHKPLIDVNDDSRPDDDYIVIGALSNGDPVLIKKESETVSIFNQEAGRIEDDEVYDDFFVFVNDLYAILGIGE